MLEAFSLRDNDSSPGLYHCTNITPVVRHMHKYIYYPDAHQMTILTKFDRRNASAIRNMLQFEFLIPRREVVSS